MKPIGTHNYWLYILTNTSRTVLYIGVTNNLERRIEEHKLDVGEAKSLYFNSINVVSDTTRKPFNISASFFPPL